MENINSPRAPGDLFRAGAGYAEQFADLIPGPSVMKVLGDLSLGRPERSIESALKFLDRPVPVDVVADRSYGLDQGVLGGVYGFGHAMRVGAISGNFKQPLDGGCASPYCLPRGRFQAALEGVVHSHRTQSASDATTEQNGPDTATLTSQAGPTTRNL